MNYKMVLKVLGNVMLYESILLLIPLGIALAYGDGDSLAFLITIILMIPIALLLRRINIEGKDMYAKEGFLTVGLTWIVISAFGALPFVAFLRETFQYAQEHYFSE